MTGGNLKSYVKRYYLVLIVIYLIYQDRRPSNYLNMPHLFSVYQKSRTIFINGEPMATLGGALQ